MKQYKNEHEWGVIAQCKNPYREFQYCPLCKQYKEDRQLYTSVQFRLLVKMNALTNNPMFEPDSNRLLGDY